MTFEEFLTNIVAPFCRRYDIECEVRGPKIIFTTNGAPTGCYVEMGSLKGFDMYRPAAFSDGILRHGNPVRNFNAAAYTALRMGGLIKLEEPSLNKPIAGRFKPRIKS